MANNGKSVCFHSQCETTFRTFLGSHFLATPGTLDLINHLYLLQLKGAPRGN
ncbi:hypothetical protein HRM2_28090 [Desulforapulum autotrophicum HRM2]|uniref:Uncharacterized protein n=1 Tax=Desulforapulum autotrophicum (strain ATCC 43914 / DSM 3382 / VKM B-1955 / HRM2) TaxID=177437 RepID=C0QJ85_DESAH|nr:hypothetical protein HRM2_28090 [Desulforapulum autotrophicum HRM2]